MQTDVIYIQLLLPGFLALWYIVKNLTFIKTLTTNFECFGGTGGDQFARTDFILINIKVFEKKESIARVRVTGHGGSKKGEDIVCSAVSSITQTALAGLLYYGNNYINWHKEHGLLDISISVSEDQGISVALNAILRTMVLGLRGVSKEYPERIRLELCKDVEI